MSSSAVPAASATPYDRLTPDRMLDALGSAGLRGDGRFIALNSYENRVYQVSLEDDRVVVAKFYRPARWSDAQILEEHAYVAELAEREIPVVSPMLLEAVSPMPEHEAVSPMPPKAFSPLPSEAAQPFGIRVPASGVEAASSVTLASFDGYRFAVYPRRGGRTPELDDSGTLEWIGRFIGRMHAVGAIAPFIHRPSIDLATLGEEPRDWLLAHGLIPAGLMAAWTGAVEQALEGARRAFDRAGAVRSIRLHGDCHAGNVLWTDQGPHFVDFDDARTGPAIQDLWMLLSGDRADMTRQLSDVIAGYEDFADFDRRELQLVEALRTLRLIHYSAWIARRWDDPAFPAAFPWFGSELYWQNRVLELREQVAAMQEPALEGV